MIERKQHERDIKNRKTTNGFYEHSRGKVGHKPDWSGTVFVAKEKHWRARKILTQQKTCGMGEF